MSNCSKPQHEDVTRRQALGLTAGAVAAGALATSPTQAASTPHRQSEFAGKIVLITGATSGIGRATVERFARYGASVFFCGRRRNLGQELQDAIRDDGGDATYMFADVREEDTVKAFIDGCIDRHGRIDIAVNNAGINGDLTARITTDTLANWDDIMNTNARGIWLAMKYELPTMTARGEGKIINIASLLGMRSVPFIASYVASKHAVIGISQAAAAQHGADGVRINVIAPGPTDTAMLRRIHHDDPERLEAFRRGIPVGALATADDIAAGIEMLASHAGAYLHGAVINVDGGKSHREYGAP